MLYVSRSVSREKIEIKTKLELSAESTSINIEEKDIEEKDIKNTSSSDNDKSKSINKSTSEQVSDFTKFFIDSEDEKQHTFLSEIDKNAIYKTSKIVDISSGRVMCKKVLIPEDEAYQHLQNIMKEFEILQNIDHPSICKIYGINTSEYLKNDESGDDITTVALFLEYLEYKLKDSIEKVALSNTNKSRIAIEVAHGLNYLHKKSMIYRDLKSDSIRLNFELNAKIVDFGFVKINETLCPNYTSTQNSIYKNFGDMIFMSPELLNEDDYDFKTDVYSYGILLYLIFTGHLPKMTMKQKASGQEVKLPEESESISKFCIDLIDSCLSLNPEDRPSFEEILEAIRSNGYLLAPEVNSKIVEIRDKELIQFE